MARIVVRVLCKQRVSDIFIRSRTDRHGRVPPFSCDVDIARRVFIRRGANGRDLPVCSRDVVYLRAPSRKLHLSRGLLLLGDDFRRGGEVAGRTYRLFCNSRAQRLRRHVNALHGHGVARRDAHDVFFAFSNGFTSSIPSSAPTVFRCIRSCLWWCSVLPFSAKISPSCR